MLCDVVLSTEETEILAYLKSYPDEFVSLKEFNRRAGGKTRCQEEPPWARPFLRLLPNKELIEINENGRYRYRRPGRIHKKKKGSLTSDGQDSREERKEL